MGDDLDPFVRAFVAVSALLGGAGPADLDGSAEDACRLDAHLRSGTQRERAAKLGRELLPLAERLAARGLP